MQLLGYIFLYEIHLSYCGMHTMFRIEKPEMMNKTFRLPVDLVERMQKVAQEKGVSLNNLVIQSCEYALDNLEQDP